MENGEKRIESFEEAKVYLQNSAERVKGNSEIRIKQSKYIIALFSALDLAAIASTYFGIDSEAVLTISKGVLLGSPGILAYAINRYINSNTLLKGAEDLLTGKAFKEESEEEIIARANEKLDRKKEGSGLNK